MGSAMEFGAHNLWWHLPSYGWEIILITSFFTCLIVFRLNKTLKKYFIQFYLLSLVLKLLMGGFLVGLILWLDKRLANENAITVLITYIVFTSLEVFFLYNAINKPDKTEFV